MVKNLVKIVLPFFLGLLCAQNIYSQKFQHSILGGANLPLGAPEKFITGVTIKYEFEFAFNNYFSLGISPFLNIVNYNVTTYDKVGTTVSQEKEMEISSGIPSLTFYPKICIPISDGLTIFATYGLSGYTSSSRAFLTKTNYQTSDVVTKSYKSNSKIILGMDASIGLQIDCTDNFDLISKLSWYSADVGHSINDINFNSDWPSINVKSSLISFSVGLAFPVFHKK